MIKRIILTVLTAMTVSCYAQNSRLLSMGGMAVAIADSDYSLNLYDFGENPSWLINDEHMDYLRVSSSVNRIDGDYKREFDFKSCDLYAINFKGIKPLGENGTFMGYTSYNYDRRYDVYRALKYDPYSGEAFQPQDTTTGNFRYNGPSVGFGYSYEIFKDFFFGANAGYQVQEGLKYGYSNATSTLRDVSGRFGISYRFSDCISLGMTYGLYDIQESLEMASTDVTNVEIKNYRGDSFATTIRSTEVDQKIKRKGNVFGAQAYYKPSGLIELAAKGNYDISGARILLPNVNIKEFEEGYASFENYNFQLRANYYLQNNFRLSLLAGYNSKDSWSKNSARDLLLWKWNIKSVSSIFGCSYLFKQYNVLIGMEYEFIFNKADSSKYIDAHFNKVNSFDNYIRIGAEYTFNNDLILRAGYNIGYKQYDMVYGGKDVNINYISSGIAVKPYGIYELELCIAYGVLRPESITNNQRRDFNLSVSAKFFNF